MAIKEDEQGGIDFKHKADLAKQISDKKVEPKAPTKKSAPKTATKSQEQTNTETMKTLNNTDIKGTSTQVPDVEVFGDGDGFKLIIKASSKSEGWMKSTKAMDVGKGCIVQVTTQQKNPDGSYAVAEALTYVPNVAVKETKDDSGVVISRQLVGAR